MHLVIWLQNFFFPKRGKDYHNTFSGRYLIVYTVLHAFISFECHTWLQVKNQGAQVREKPWGEK